MIATRHFPRAAAFFLLSSLGHDVLAQNQEAVRLPPATAVAPATSPVPARHASAVSKPRNVYASWYRVPPNSRVRRRAGDNEFTAAHNHLPFGTLVRVTNPKNGRNVVVRITDRGIHDRRAKIDLCREAAQELDFVREGMIRVRIEIVPPQPPLATSDGGVMPGH